VHVSASYLKGCSRGIALPHLINTVQPSRLCVGYAGISVSALFVKSTLGPSSRYSPCAEPSIASFQSLTSRRLYGLYLPLPSSYAVITHPPLCDCKALVLCSRQLWMRLITLSYSIDSYFLFALHITILHLHFSLHGSPWLSMALHDSQVSGLMLRHSRRLRSLQIT